MSSIQPGNPSEWQLYKVLQRSNLLQYYDTFIAQGKSHQVKVTGCDLDPTIRISFLRYMRFYICETWIVEKRKIQLKCTVCIS